MQELIKGFELGGYSEALRSVCFKQLGEVVLEVINRPISPFLIELFVDDLLIKPLKQSLVELARDVVVGFVQLPRLFAEETPQALESLSSELKLREDVLKHEDVLPRVEQDLLLLGLNGVSELELVQGQLEVFNELRELILQTLGVAEQGGL